MKCKYIYTDANGNPSAIYERALQKYGPEKAEEIYIRHMMGAIDTRFSKDISHLGQLDERSTSIKLNDKYTEDSPESDNVYIHETSGQRLARVTSEIARYIHSKSKTDGKFSSLIPNAKSSEETTKIMLERGLEKQALELIGEQAPVEIKADPEKLAAYITQNTESKLAAAKRDIQAFWDAQTEWGTDFHDTVAAVLEQWEELYQQQTPNEDGTLPDLPANALYQAVINAKDHMKGDWFVNGKSGEPKFKEGDLYKALLPLIDRIKSEEKAIGKRLIFKPEIQVYTTSLKPKGSNYDGIAGSIDLLLVTEDKSHAITVDFKSKNNLKTKDFNKPTGSLIGGPFMDIENTAFNRATSQQRMYAAILKEQGIDVAGTMTVIAPMNYVPAEYGAAMGENTFKVSSLGKMDPTATVPVGNSVETILTYFREGDLPTYYDEQRKKGIAGITESWSGEQPDGQPNATFSKGNKDPYIKRKLQATFKNPQTGNLSVQVFDKVISVEGKSEEEMTKIIGAYYDAAKESQVNIAKDIISYFEHPEVVPKGLIGKHNVISKLLQGFTREHYTIEMAQAYPELASIGPDVLVLKNIKTKAVSLISAVTTGDSRVVFQTDESGEKRTSFLGKYLTDKEVSSKMVQGKLITDPTAHDFLLTKLGIAALYLNKRAGNKLVIDKMRIASVTHGNRAQVTSTTPEQELSKLSAMRKAAGDEFPKEYGVMLDAMNSNQYIGSTANHLEHLMLQISDKTDPLGVVYYHDDLKKDLQVTYEAYKAGELVSHDLKLLLGKYLEAVSHKLKISMTDGQVQHDPRFIAASKALGEFLGFENDLGKLAAERLSTGFLKGAVTSGDKIQSKLHVLYNEASANIRKDMDQFTKDHTIMYNALLKDANADIVSLNPNAVFTPLYRDASSNAENRMMLKEEGTAEFNALTGAQKNYIKFFNSHVRDAIMDVSADRYRAEIEDGRFWKEGTVPVIERVPKVISKENMKSWSKLRKAIGKQFDTMGKKTSGSKSVLEYGLTTKFDSQATDEGVGHSRVRRRALGLEDLGAIDPEWSDSHVEKNLALILNMSKLEASEKSNYSILLQSVNAAHGLLAAEGDEERTGMTSEMIKMWREMVILGRYKEEPSKRIAAAVDATNRASSTMLFAYSVKQAMIEFFTGTLQNSAALISNSVQNAVADFILKDTSKKGRFTPKDWAWASKAWTTKYDEKLTQIVYDHGMLQADSNDLKTPEFRGQNKSRTFKSKAGYFLNRVFFNTAITHTFLAEVKALGIVDAYKKTADGEWIYDETLDKRFYVYDPKNNLGDKAPVTKEEKIKHSLWVATRKELDKENMIDRGTMRMIVPMTANQRAEIKHYATRLYGSFNNDAKVHGEALAIGRAMFRYKKWMTQRIANYWTPTIRNDAMYGHFQTELDEETGEYHSVWVGDDFEGILQTLGHMVQEVWRTKHMSFNNNLNKYQRENISKLFADIIMVLIMAILVLPFLEDKEEHVNPETGKTETVTGPLGTLGIGQSAFKAATNAVADLMFINSLPSMTESLFPGLGVASGAILSGGKAIASTVTPKYGTTGEVVKQGAMRTGAGRTGINIVELFQEPKMQ